MDDYLESQRLLLQKRRQTKKQILKDGGEQSLSHSWNDIKRIDAALERLNNGEYGLCCNCVESIDLRRLASIPETPFCFACATTQ